jgi:hypothetical protein
MRKPLVVTVMTVGALVALAGPALAKGPMVPIEGMVVITGPGLDEPITVVGEFEWYEGVVSESESPANDLTYVLQSSGLLQAGPEVGWYVLPPDPATLGPAYQVTEYLDVEGKGLDAAVPTTATLYPYAPERPLAIVSVPLPRSTAHRGVWWSGPPGLKTRLVSLGLPAAPVDVSAPIEVPARSHPLVASSPASVWMILFASSALLGLVVLGALSGRRRSARAII